MFLFDRGLVAFLIYRIINYVRWNPEAWSWGRRLWAWEEELVVECRRLFNDIVLQPNISDR